MRIHWELPMYRRTALRAPCGNVGRSPTRGLGTLGPALVFAAACGAPNAAQRDIHGPPGSGAFGASVTVLDNGNIVVADPGYDGPGPVVDIGAVHVYSPQGTLISTLTGSSENDRVGNAIAALWPGYFLVLSPGWDRGDLAEAGAVTVVDAATGLDGVVSEANSLLGDGAGDLVGNVVYAYDASHDQLVVGRPESNIVTLLDFRVFGDGFE